jgi:hypothetical protein
MESLMAFIRSRRDPNDTEQSVKLTVLGKNISLEVKNLSAENAANLLFAAMMTIINADDQDDVTEVVNGILKTIGGHKNAQ